MTQTAEPAAAVEEEPPGRRTRSRFRLRSRVHLAWFVAAVTFVTITGAAAFRSLPGLLIDPLHQEFAW